MMNNAKKPLDIDRAFIRIEEGLLHYRHIDAPPSDNLPLYLIHAGPVSSASLAPLLRSFGGDRRLIAPDTLGYGDSAPPSLATPCLGYFADSVARTLDALEIEKVDFYGTHTGAHIGCEFAIRHPHRVRRIIFDGMGVYEGETRKDYLANYAPHKAPDEYGSQFTWAWQFLRDQSFFFPHFKKTPEHRLDGGVMPDDMLHEFTLDVLKALRTYHMGYEAVFRHETRQRLPLIDHSLFLMAQSWDPMKDHINRLHSVAPEAQKRLFKPSEGFEIVANEIECFLDKK